MFANPVLLLVISQMHVFYAGVGAIYFLFKKYAFYGV
jgi:hypothetical protein